MQPNASSMPDSEILNRVQQRTRGLVAENLRSAAIVIARLRDLISEAHHLGHSHKDIHASMETGGLRASLNTYKSCLMRMKRSTSAATAKDRTPEASMAPAVSPLRVASGSAIAGGLKTLNLGTLDLVALDLDSGTRSATHVLDALSEARQAASRDYAQ